MFGKTNYFERRLDEALNILIISLLLYQGTIMKFELTVGLKIRASVIEILRFCTIIRFFYFAFVGGREKYQKNSIIGGFFKAKAK